jgi:hypothetical protein
MAHRIAPTSCSLLILILLTTLPASRAGAVPGDADSLAVAARWAMGPAQAVHAATDLLLVGEGSRVRVFDNSDPDDPEFLGRVRVHGVVLGIDRAGDLAAVAADRGGLRLVDLSDPDAPREIGASVTDGVAHAVQLVDGRAVLAEGVAGLRVCDVADPANPVELGAYTQDVYPIDVAVVGDRAYVADNAESAVKVFDVSDPADIRLEHTVALSYMPMALDADGTRAVVVDDYTGITAFDLAPPSAPALAAGDWLPSTGHDVRVDGDLAFVAQDLGGLSVVDLDAATGLPVLGTVGTAGDGRGIAVLGARAHLADGFGGVRVIDVSTPTDPVPVWSQDGVGELYKVCTEGSVGYVVDPRHGLHLLRATAEGDALHLSTVAIAGGPQRLDVEDAVVYVAAGETGVVIVDASMPHRPQVLATIELPEYALGSGAVGVSVDGDRLAVVDRYWGLYVFDVTDPAAPAEIGRLGTIAFPRDVLLRADHAYVADRDGPVRVIDVTSMTNVGYAALTGTNYDLELDGDRLYVAKDWRGITVLDVSDPTAPAAVDLIDTPGGAQDLSASSPWLYVADGFCVRAYDTSDPADVVEVGHFECDDFAIGVCAVGRTVHVAGWEGGWYQLDNLLQPVAVRPPGSAVDGLRLRVAPNPFNPRTTFVVDAPGPGRVVVEVFDARGRRVTRRSEALPAGGRVEIPWSARDDQGRALASGVYLVRASHPTGERVRRAVLVR